jgi:hypothetical protein
MSRENRIFNGKINTKLKDMLNNIEINKNVMSEMVSKS